MIAGIIGADGAVDERFDGANFLVGHRLRVREIESRAFGIDQRALLLHMVAENLAQRGVHQVRRGMVERRTLTLVGIHLCADDVAHAKLASLHLSVMADDVGLDFLRIVNRKQRQTNSALGELAAVSDLTARFGIERSAIEHDNPFLPDA